MSRENHSDQKGGETDGGILNSNGVRATVTGATAGASRTQEPHGKYSICNQIQTQLNPVSRDACIHC